MANTSRALVWTGRVLSALTVVGLAFSAVMKFRRPPEVVDFFVNKFGYPDATLATIGILEIACAVLYAIPQTAVLGAILVTAFFGGAFVSHLRIGDAAGGSVPVVLAAMAWIGLYLRDERLRSLIPLRGLWRERA